MAKQLIHDYTFTPSANTVVINSVVKEERLLLITNVNSGIPIYLFSDPAKKYNSVSHDYQAETTTIVLEYNCTAMTDSDPLQIFIESDASTMEMSDTFLDAVSKIRVSTPENLIDTDFEYGLQSTKWETLERVKNIPTFFSRTGDDSLVITGMSTISGSDVVTVTTEVEHNFAKGYPVLVVGSKNITCDGGFVVTNILNLNSFQYKAKGIQNFTGSILDTYTQVFPANKYQGTEFKLDNINSIITDEAAGGSKLTVTTAFPTAFANNTSFFLTNSVSTLEERIDAANAVVFDNFDSLSISSYTSNVSGSIVGSAKGLIDADDYIAREAFYFDMADATFSGSPNYTVTFPYKHGFSDKTYVVWNPGAGETLYGTDSGYWNTNFGGGQMWAGYGYVLRRVDDYTFWLERGYNNTTRIILTQPTIPSYNNNTTRSCFMRGYFLEYHGFTYSNYSVFNGYFEWQVSGQASKYPNLVVGGSNATPCAFYNINPYFAHQNSWSGMNISGMGTTNAYLSGQNIFSLRDPYDGLYRYSPYIYYPYGYLQQGAYYANGFYQYRYYYTWSTSPGSNPVTFGSGAPYFIMVPLALNANRNSFYLENHGLSTDDQVKLSYNVSGLSPIQNRVSVLTNNIEYPIEYVDSNRFRLKSDTGAILQIQSPGANGAYTFTSNVANSLSDTIFIQNSLLSDNTAVTYNANGNPDLGGLSNNSTYYVFQKQNNRFRLTSTEGGLVGNPLTVFHGSTSYSLDYIYTSTHGKTTANNGDLVIYTATTPIGGLKNGNYYYVRYWDPYRFSLHRSYAGAVNNTDKINLAYPFTGTGQLQFTSVVDFSAAGTGEHLLTATEFGAADGVYKITNDVSSNTFELLTNSTIKSRNYQIPISTLGMIPEFNAIRVPGHGFTQKTLITYETTGTALNGLDNASPYYTYVLGPDWFSLANTISDIDTGNIVQFDTSGASGTHRIYTNSVSGEKAGRGTVTVSATEKVIIGTNTNFTSVFTAGDDFVIYYPPDTTTISVTANNLNETFTYSGSHGYSDGDIVKISWTGTAITGINTELFYYVNQSSTTLPLQEFTLHPTYSDAIAGTNVITFSSNGSGVQSTKYSDVGTRYVDKIDYVNGQSQVSLENEIANSATNIEYAIPSSLLIRADGFALHRPYDGGVELIPSSNPDGNMVRQTRKYFRYQSGKGIQVSLAVNFSPTTPIDTLTRSGTTATITTRYPHRLTAGLNVVVSGATTASANNYWNGEFTINTTTDYDFTITLPGTPDETTAGGLVEFYVKSWQNSLLRCGLFDDQNGLFYEYDGQDLYAVRRSSTTQISGTSSVTYKSSLVVGTNTKYSSQLSAGERIVIKGQTYLITQIDSDTQMYVLPSYTGSTLGGAIITKIIDTRVPQSQWNIDKADGTGPTGFSLDIHKIQMAYIDYSWYGAGKVRFGFKDQNGIAKYFHQFVHGNKQTEAYMRSGNLPSRYELLNVGEPTYVPALAHWGTSVIMDGRFDDDKAYVFTASSTPFNLSGSVTLDLTARVETTSYYYNISGNQLKSIGYALDTTSNTLFNGISDGLVISGTGLQAGTKTSNPYNSTITPYQPYLGAIYSSIGYNNRNTRNLIVLDRQPTSTAANGTYTITYPTTQTVTGVIPLISIRLAPSVDTGSPGLLGEREIINRMQLILNSVGILSTHTVEVQLVLNGTLSTNTWQRVNSPSLSQLLYHSNKDTIYGGAIAYSFRAEGGTGTTGRSPSLTQQDLGEVATLGNSILGGNGAFPDGPDVLTVTARLIEDASTVSTSNPFEITGRISWSESQA